MKLEKQEKHIENFAGVHHTFSKFVEDKGEGELASSLFDDGISTGIGLREFALVAQFHPQAEVCYLQADVGQVRQKQIKGIVQLQQTEE